MSRLRRRLSRLPLRGRLVAGFVVTMFLVLLVAGGFVYWRVQTALDQGLDESLVGAADSLAPSVTPSGHLPADKASLARIDGFQVLDRTGRVLDDDARLGAVPVLAPRQVADALAAPLFRDIGELLPIAHRPLRLYAVPAGDKVLVVALRRDEHDEALRELLVQLITAGLGALLLTGFVGDRLARAALRPVESYRAQAARIAAGSPHLRLDVPPDRDDEITRLGHTLNAMLAALEEALARERRFIDDASHELRTPLTVLTSRVQLMLRRPRSLEEHEAALEEIREDLSRMTDLADQLLELGTVQQATDTGPSNLVAVAARTVEARVELAAPGTAYHQAGALRLTTEGDLHVALAALTLARIIDNLLENAAAHGAPPVEVRADRWGDWVRLVVHDSGVGMGPDLLATATERFARSAEARARPGAGLGLSLVADAVTRAGGQLRLCSAGHHHRLGHDVPLPCDHDAGMTATVFLPPASS